MTVSHGKLIEGKKEMMKKIEDSHVEVKENALIAVQKLMTNSSS